MRLEEDSSSGGTLLQMFKQCKISRDQYIAASLGGTLDPWASTSSRSRCETSYSVLFKWECVV